MKAKWVGKTFVRMLLKFDIDNPGCKAFILLNEKAVQSKAVRLKWVAKAFMRMIN